MPSPVAVAEDLLDKVPSLFKRFLPTILLVRVYDCGNPTFSPHPFRYAVVIKCLNGVAEVKGMVYSDIKIKDVRAIVLELLKFGVRKVWWEHGGKLVELQTEKFKKKEKLQE